MTFWHKNVSLTCDENKEWWLSTFGRDVSLSSRITVNQAFHWLKERPELWKSYVEQQGAKTPLGM